MTKLEKAQKWLAKRLLAVSTTGRDEYAKAKDEGPNSPHWEAWGLASRECFFLKQIIETVDPIAEISNELEWSYRNKDMMGYPKTERQIEEHSGLSRDIRILESIKTGMLPVRKRVRR